MSRAINAATLAALMASAREYVVAVEILFDGTPLRIVNGFRDVVFEGNTYESSGALGSITSPEEEADLAAAGITIGLSGIPNELVALFMGTHYLGRPVRCFIIALDATGAVIGEPFEFFAGVLDEPDITRGAKTSSISIPCESELSDLRRSRERKRTNEDQQALYPGDKGFEYVAGLEGATIKWGRKWSASEAYIGGGGSISAPPSYTGWTGD